MNRHAPSQEEGSFFRPVYLNTKSMYNSSPKPLRIAIKVILLHTFGVQGGLTNTSVILRQRCFKETLNPKPYILNPKSLLHCLKRKLSLRTSCGGYGGFLKLGVPFLGVPIIRSIVFWGSTLGSLILGNYHIRWVHADFLEEWPWRFSLQP